MGGRGWWTVERGDLIRYVIPSGEVDAVLAAYETKKNTPEAAEEEQQMGDAAFDESMAEVLQCMANDPTNEDEFQPLKVGLEKLRKRQYQRRLRLARARGIIAIAANKEKKRKQLERKRKKTNVGEGQGSTPLLPCRNERRTGNGRGQGGRRAVARAVAPAPAVEPPPAVEPVSVVVCTGGAGDETAPPAANPSAAVLPPLPPAAGPGAEPKVLEVERAVAFVLKVLRKGDDNQLAEVKRHVAAGKDFFVGKHNCYLPAKALEISLSKYEEEKRASKPATLPAAPAPPSPAAEEPPTADGSRLADSQADEDAASRAAKGQRVVGRGRGVPLKDKFDLNDGNTQLQSYNGRKEESLRKRGTTRRKREEERLTRQREQGEEDKKLAKRENKRARKDEQGGERAKRRSSSTSSSGESESAEEGSSDDDVIFNGKPLLRQTVSPTE